MTDEQEKKCPLGDDCDLATAYMHGHSEGRLSIETERDEALNQLSSMTHAVRMLEKRVEALLEDREAQTHQLSKTFREFDVLEAENKRLREALVKAALEHRVIAGMDLMGASSAAYNAAREAETALEGKK